MAGIKYSFELELRDRGRFGFLLPANYIQPVGEEMWSAVRVLSTHIVTERGLDAATTVSYTTASHLSGASDIQAIFSVCAVIRDGTPSTIDYFNTLTTMCCGCTRMRCVCVHAH